MDTTDDAGTDSSLVIDRNGFPVVLYTAYVDFDLGLALRIAHCNDPNCAGNNESIVTVATNTSSHDGSLALDHNGFPVIIYPGRSGTRSVIKLMHCNDPNCAGNDESITDLGFSTTLTLASYTASLALDSNGFPVVSYKYEPDFVMLAHCNDPNCAGNNESIQLVTRDDVVVPIGLRLDNSGYPVLSYVEQGVWTLSVVRCNDPNCAGGDEHVQIIDRGVHEPYSLALDSDGFPVISYYAPQSGGLKLVHCNDPKCVVNNSVVNLETNGYNSSLVLDSRGFPVISYSGSERIGVMHCNDPNCTGNNESIQATAANLFGSFALALDSNGFPVISYSFHTDRRPDALKLVHCDDVNCEPTCGNSVVEGSEWCDDGNTVNGDCCSSVCRFESYTTVCRPSAGICDLAERCDAGVCPAQTFQSPSTVCRAASGECDVAENCTGASTDCPSDGVKINGTACMDDGNGCTDTCNGSSTECQYSAGNAGTVCRASTGVCDVAETCTGASLSCPADTGAPDSDGDGQCDANDVCTNGVAITGGKIGLSNFATGNGDDAVKFSGTLAFAALPMFDPIANGVRVRVEDADGALFDVTVPGGTYNATTKTGWKVNAVGSSWKFSSPTAVGGAITQVTLTKRTPQVKFTVKGVKGMFAAQPVTFPLQATVVLTPPLGVTGTCGGTSFAASQCAFNATQTTLSCK